MPPGEDKEGVAGAPRDETAFEFEPEPDDPPGPILLDGIPPVPEAIVDSLARYLNAKQTRLVAVAPGGGTALVISRAERTAQVFSVDGPLSPPSRLTAEPDPINQAGYLSWSPRVLVYRVDTHGDELYQIVRLDLATRRRTLLSDGKSRHGNFAIAPGGKLIAYTSNARSRADMDLYVRDTTGTSAARRLLSGGGQWVASSFAPSGASLVVRAYRSAEDSSLHLLELATGHLTRVAPLARRSADRSAQVGANGRLYFTSDRAGGFVELHQWRPGAADSVPLTRHIPWDVEMFTVRGDKLAFAVNEDGQSAIYVRDLSSGEELQIEALPRGVIGELALVGRGGSLFVSLATATRPRDVYQVDLPSGRVVQWTRSGLSDLRFVAPERVRIQSFDGLEIPGFLYRPRGDGPHPVLVWLHGGPESQFRPAFHPIIQYLVVESGIAVLAPNVRGSSGYGRGFLALDNGRRRGDAIRDVGAVLDWIGTAPGLDAARVGVYGASYGGFLTLAALSEYGDRLAAGCEAVGISDIVTFLDGTSVYRQESRRLEYGDERQEAMREYLRAISPLSQVDRIRSPLFVAHGARDPRVPVKEAEQIVKAVRERGVDVWYMLAPDEGHSFRRRRTRDLFYQLMVAFFERHLTDSRTADPPVQREAPGR